MKQEKEKEFRPYQPSDRTKNGYLTLLIASSTSITLRELAELLGLPVDSLVRYGIDLTVEHLSSASIGAVPEVIKRSSRHHVPEQGLEWGWGYREHEMKATLPKTMPQFKECSDSESWGERKHKIDELLSTRGE